MYRHRYEGSMWFHVTQNCAHFFSYKNINTTLISKESQVRVTIIYECGFKLLQIPWTDHNKRTKNDINQDTFWKCIGWNFKERVEQNSEISAIDLGYYLMILS